MIQIKNLSKQFRLRNGSVVEVLKGIDLDVPDRSITAVIGPSGAGKTTLSRCISLLEQASSGSILVNGEELSALDRDGLRRARRAIGTIFQSSALLRRKTVAENIALPLRYLGVVESDIQRRVRELLVSVGLPDKVDYFPDQLSGGQRQRVGIARALVLHPQVLLADEATSGLDPEATESILALLKSLRDEFGLSIILITHEMSAVRDVADNVALIQAGRIVEQGSVRQLIADPLSGIGRQLLPVRPLIQYREDEWLLELTYRADREVPADWISQISEHEQARVSLLGGSIEQVAGRLSGRVITAVRFARDDVGGVAQLSAYLARIGLNVTVLRSPQLVTQVTEAAA